MARTTSYAVKRIVETELTDLSPFITAANLLVTSKLGDSDLSASLLTEIETWLAAHLLTCKERQPNKVRMGESETSYNWNTGKGLDSSYYGQTVRMLDTTGTLAAEAGKPGILFDVAMDLPTDTD